MDYKILINNISYIFSKDEICKIPYYNIIINGEYSETNKQVFKLDCNTDDFGIIYEYIKLGTIKKNIATKSFIELCNFLLINKLCFECLMISNEYYLYNNNFISYDDYILSCLNNNGVKLDINQYDIFISNPSKIINLFFDNLIKNKYVSYKEFERNEKLYALSSFIMSYKFPFTIEKLVELQDDNLININLGLSYKLQFNNFKKLQQLKDCKYYKKEFNDLYIQSLLLNNKDGASDIIEKYINDNDNDNSDLIITLVSNVEYKKNMQKNIFEILLKKSNLYDKNIDKIFHFLEISDIEYINIFIENAKLDLSQICILCNIIFINNCNLPTKTKLIIKTINTFFDNISYNFSYENYLTNSILIKIYELFVEKIGVIEYIIEFVKQTECKIYYKILDYGNNITYYCKNDNEKTYLIYHLSKYYNINKFVDNIISETKDYYNNVKDNVDIVELLISNNIIDEENLLKIISCDKINETYIKKENIDDRIIDLLIDSNGVLSVSILKNIQNLINNKILITNLVKSFSKGKSHSIFLQKFDFFIKNTNLNLDNNTFTYLLYNIFTLNIVFEGSQILDLISNYGLKYNNDILFDEMNMLMIFCIKFKCINRNKKIEIIKYFIDNYDIDLNFTTKTEKQNILILLLKFENNDSNKLLKFFVDNYGIDFNYKDIYNKKAIDYCDTKSKMESFTFIIEKIDNEKELSEIIENNRLHYIDDLILQIMKNKNYNINYHDNNVDPIIFSLIFRNNTILNHISYNNIKIDFNLKNRYNENIFQYILNNKLTVNILINNIRKIIGIFEKNIDNYNGDIIDNYNEVKKLINR